MSVSNVLFLWARGVDWGTTVQSVKISKKTHTRNLPKRSGISPARRRETNGVREERTTSDVPAAKKKKKKRNYLPKIQWSFPKSFLFSFFLVLGRVRLRQCSHSYSDMVPAAYRVFLLLHRPRRASGSLPGESHCPHSTPRNKTQAAPVQS